MRGSVPAAFRLAQHSRRTPTDLVRPDLTGEAIRLTSLTCALMPGAELAGNTAETAALTRRRDQLP